MAKFIDGLMNMLNLNDYEDAAEEDFYQDDFNSFTGEPRPVKKEIKTDFRKVTHYPSVNKPKPASSPKVVNFQANVKLEVVVIQPNSYDEAQTIADHIRSQSPVVVNLESLDHNIAQRIMDFVSGSCYTLGGNLERVTQNIFIIAPENIDISGHFQEELKSNGIILPWRNE